MLLDQGGEQLSQINFTEALASTLLETVEDRSEVHVQLEAPVTEEPSMRMNVDSDESMVDKETQTEELDATFSVSDAKTHNEEFAVFPVSDTEALTEEFDYMSVGQDCHHLRLFTDTRGKAIKDVPFMAFRRPRSLGDYLVHAKRATNTEWCSKGTVVCGSGTGCAIVNGKQHDKDWLIRKLQSACEEPFQAVDFHYFKGESAAFFVEGSKVAEAMKKVSHKITVRDGSKLILTVRPSPPPHNPSNVFGSFADSYTGNVGSSSNLDDNTKEVLKQCLGERYDATSKILNLSDLYHDEVLNLNNVQGILSKYPLASAIVRLIGENCPEVQSLDISSNRLRNLDGFKDLGNQASSLKHLKICNNQLRTVEELDKIKSLNQLVSLELDGNPLCDVFQSKGNSYINSVRSRFPKVTSLDGHELPAPIGFDLPSEQVLPPSKDSFLGDPPIKELVLKFLEQYFKIYDTGDRQGLLEAYHDQAIFSLCVNTGVTTKDRSGQRGPSLGEYLKNSRNMKRVIDPERRYSYLKHSRLSVVAFLNELPTTKHDLSSFKIDVSLALPSCLSFAVRGLFLENSKSLRSFTRVFLAVPAAGGKALSIINDELHIRNASSAQVEGTGSESAVPDSQNVSTPQESRLAVTSPQQQEMLLRFSQQSTMNLEWSYKCLSENNWDYQKAALVFTSLKNNGSIPPEAFVQST
ncbi:unnamed protein product [Porites evermanni]|uniref:Nuclear RNA export factor 1 n=1 Tax=Porites evermanni TaxID=104178 RepID=A0ABN8LGU8_9CNID|nr:unnamed protein product [Porites evermanni]